MSDKRWIAKAIQHPGALHKELHVPQGQKIPAKKLEKAEHSSNPTLRHRAQLAETLSHMHHSGNKPHSIHAAHKRSGPHRLSGHSGAHRIGKR